MDRPGGNLLDSLEVTETERKPSVWPTTYLGGLSAVGTEAFLRKQLNFKRLRNCVRPMESQSGMPSKNRQTLRLVEGDRSPSASDRRQQPTPMFSRYTFVGRRRRNRRGSDPRWRYYVDWIDGRYRAGLIAVVLFILMDAFSTLHIIAQGGGEANPLMAWMLERGDGWFVLTKVFTAIIGFLLLAVHRFFPIARALAVLLLAAYGGIVLYHTYLLLQIYI